MSASQEIAILIGVAALVGYPIVMRVLAERLQPSRLRMLDVGKLLLAHASVPAEHKHIIDSMLRDAYNPTVMILVAITMPYYVILRVVGKIKAPPRISDVEARQMDDDFCRLFIVSIAAANPIFSVIVGLEIGILSLILFPLGKLSKTQEIQFGTIQTVDKTLQAFGRVWRGGAA
jgi:hypothetical protein